MQAAEEVPEHEEEDGSEQEAEKEEEQKFAHMALVEPVDLPTGKSEKIMKLKEKILHFKKVMTTVKLIVEPATEDQLTDLFVASFMADYKDEKCHYPGSNRGDTIYGVVMPSFDDKKCWKLSVKDKRLLYDKHRIAVGGACPEGDTGGRKSDTTVEPVFFHAGPYNLDDELVASHAIGAINDLTPGCGNLAMIAIRRNLPYIGLCFTEKHVDELTARLESLVFASMQDARDPLHSPELVKVIADLKKLDKNNKDGNDEDDQDGPEDEELEEDGEVEEADKPEEEKEPEEELPEVVFEDDDDQGTPKFLDDEDQDQEEVEEVEGIMDPTPKPKAKAKAKAKAKGRASAKAKGKKGEEHQPEKKPRKPRKKKGETAEEGEPLEVKPKAKAKSRGKRVKEAAPQDPSLY
ncbi:Glycosyltransferase-like protein LARGE2 [Durusdinium trenchii]|uniref:Glycosyltransferase-like protein LARGE2 n=1 Tax=Durusdinium trenchii TaxID=1381693 RepID=A0ABP0HY03_9DINO